MIRQGARTIAQPLFHVLPPKKIYKPNWESSNTIDYGILFMIPALFLFDFQLGLWRFTNKLHLLNILYPLWIISFGKVAMHPCGDPHYENAIAFLRLPC